VIEVVFSSRRAHLVRRDNEDFRCTEAIIPPHQQVLHAALFNKFELPVAFSQKNNGRVIGMAFMPTSIGIALLHG
jgi:hypothetical protein